MRVAVIEPPQPVVTVEEARRQIIDLPAEDEAYVESLISAATAWIDGPAGWLGRCIGLQKLELLGWIGCSRIKLPYPPVVSLDSIVTEDGAGAEATVDPSGYRYSRGELIVSPGALWVTQPVHRILYSAGYETVPTPIKVAILMLVAHWYRNREAVSSSPTDSIPFGVEALLSPYRVYS